MDLKVSWITILLLICDFFAIHSEVIVENNQAQYIFKPFEFSYESSDGLGTTQHRKETGDEKGSVKGSYGFTDSSGLYRAVDYVADKLGFRAVVNTNEPGTSEQNPADTVWLVKPPPEVIAPKSNFLEKVLNKPSLPAQSSTANFTPEASPSSLSNAMFSSLRLQPLRSHYAYHSLSHSTPRAFVVVPTPTFYNTPVFSNFLNNHVHFSPRRIIYKK
ncbi:protein lethal(3)malignant blood neoplasm 1-like [Argiope bruennichi]|uniref:protein lethal(3)malignant blood neoplasm 1-like n=1 Tax=Argiope bruennichi TaxID=94029 RepID=UPI002494933C|nr:protein lethal(3)malignant blood neoplasm 1-like [Argiope bruennichi]